MIGRIRIYRWNENVHTYEEHYIKRTCNQTP